MRKLYLTLLAILLPCCLLQAHPVDQQTACNLVQSFVMANFEFTRQSSELTLVKTGFSERGEACYYVFNVGETGFVIMAADDCVRPIIGYSAEGIFNPDDMVPALDSFLERKCLVIADAAQTGNPDVAVTADWAMLEKTGRLVSRHGGREDQYLVETKWHQNYPYNYFCPEDDGPGGHCYAGCVATAAAQVMKYWDHPLQGQGSHTYTPEDHPEYGPLTVNFGEAVYDWENMPVSISGNSPQVEIDAVAQLIYHVGVSVDMNYRPGSSGAVTTKLCETMPLYFFYTDNMINQKREDYTHEEYMDLIMKAIDMRWPMVHRGGGHAYVLDGYNDNDMVHFNWGWGGSSDGFFDIDDHDYTEGESVIYNCVPAEIYSATPDAPTNMSVAPSNDNSLTATISWTNPTVTLTNQALTSIDQIVVTRDGQIVYTEDNVAPGAEMSIIDETVPYFDVFDYAVFAVINGQRGKSAFVKKVLVGPTCDWNIIMQSTVFQGWRGGYISQYSATGKEILRMTMTNSTPQSLNFAMPVGVGSFGWTEPNNVVNSMSFVIKNNEGNSVYSYSGSSSGMEAGVFLSVNNGCGNELSQAVPYGLRAETEEEIVNLSWESDVDPDYGFNVYRDEQLYALVNEPTARTFKDENMTMGHCYTVTALGQGGETEHSNETCASAGDCMSATDFFFEYTGSNYKIKLTWEKPENHAGLSGYFLYRKFGADGTYERIKILGANATHYTDNSAIVEGDYYYRLYAYYGATDCTSSPASVKYNPNLFYLHVYYSPTIVDENESTNVSIFPNPADHSLSIETEGMRHVKVCNLLGQVVLDRDIECNQLNINTSIWNEGIYLIVLQSEQGTVTHRVCILH